jgi:hypothetical protein
MNVWEFTSLLSFLLKMPRKLTNMNTSHAKENMSADVYYTDGWLAVSASYSVSTKRSKCVHDWHLNICIGAWFVTCEQYKKGLRTCNRSFVMLLHYWLSLDITLGCMKTTNCVQITTHLRRYNSFTVTLSKRRFVHDWRAVLIQPKFRHRHTTDIFPVTYYIIFALSRSSCKSHILYSGVCRKSNAGTFHFVIRLIINFAVCGEKYKLRTLTLSIFPRVREYLYIYIWNEPSSHTFFLDSFILLLGPNHYMFRLSFVSAIIRWQ